MRNLFRNFKSNMAQENGDANTISIILWIAGVVVLVFLAGGAIYKATSAKAEKIKQCIENSNSYVSGEVPEECK